VGVLLGDCEGSTVGAALGSTVGTLGITVGVLGVTDGALGTSVGSAATVLGIAVWAVGATVGFTVGNLVLKVCVGTKEGLNVEGAGVGTRVLPPNPKSAGK